MLALEAFHAAHTDVALAVNVTRHPFSFLGQMPPEEDSGEAERWGGWPRLRREGKWHDRLMDYSGSAEGRDQFEDQVGRLGEAAGIKFDFNVHLDRQPVESQRLLLWAARYGKGEDFIAALSARHFQRGSEGECATCRPTLLAAAAEAGLNVTAAEAFLDTDELHEEVWAKYGEMPALGIRAIPLFCFSVPEAVSADPARWPFDSMLLEYRRCYQILTTATADSAARLDLLNACAGPDERSVSC